MSKDEKMMILKMVADGTITPEQGAEPLGHWRPDRQPLPGQRHLQVLAYRQDRYREVMKSQESIRVG